MNLGIIARADCRGIGYQSHEMVKHLDPAKVLCVLMGDPFYPDDMGRYGRHPDVTYVGSNLDRNLNNRVLDERKAREFLEGLDVVMAVETVYDWAFIDWAQEMGVRVVIQGNPEMAAHHHHPEWSHPDLWAWPTNWLIDELEALRYDTTILPVPTVERPQVAASPDDDTLKVLHVVGKPAAGDRNGTLEFIEAVASLRQQIHITVVTQEPQLPRRLRHGRNVTVDVKLSGVEDRWSLYEDQHVLVLPRKYGGLCLPAIEALSCGLTVLMPDCSPNDTWPGPRVKSRKSRPQRSPFGRIETFSVHPIDVASQIDTLASCREILHDEMDTAAWWAANNTWTELGHRLYEPLLRSVL